jgi:N-acetylneuraminate synthase
MLKIGTKTISSRHPVYFIAEIGSNFDGSMQRAIDLIHLAAQSGADAVKFQHYTANSLVSAVGFEYLADKLGHQKSWSSSVYDTYESASLDLNWTETLAKECDKCGVHFFTSAYSFDLVDKVEHFVPAYKVGSGDITWSQLLKHISHKNKPVILATGASKIEDVIRAHDLIRETNDDLILLQCNTNYENTKSNFNYLNLNVLKYYSMRFPDVILGLSDHTKNHVSTLGAIALGAKVIEKHFTDDDSRTGPDHSFALTPSQWVEMVDRSRELEAALGLPEKNIEDNESDTVVVQRRSIRAAKNLKKGTKISEEHVTMLRPCSENGLEPYRLNEVLGKILEQDIELGEEVHFATLT